MESYAATAVALYQESIPLNPDLSERSASLNNVGLILQAQGQHAAAETWLQGAIALNRAQAHFHHLGKHLMNLANLYREIRKFNEAEALLDEGATLIDRVGDRYWQAVAARYRGWLARDRGDWAQAVRSLALAGPMMRQALQWTEMRRDKNSLVFRGRARGHFPGDGPGPGAA